MSIWSSLDGTPTDIPDRDNYGEPMEGRGTNTFDVATATSWHEFVRVCAWYTPPGPQPKWEGVDAVLTLDETRALITALQAAVALVEAAR